MIDIENDVVNAVATAVHADTEFATAYVASVYEDTPPTFPAVTISEVANAVWRKGRDQSNMENMNDVAYEVNIYSNKASGKKAEAKRLAQIVDTAMEQMHFTRILFYPTPNLADATIYRYTGRYRAIVSSNGDIYYRR